MHACSKKPEDLAELWHIYDQLQDDQLVNNNNILFTSAITCKCWQRCTIYELMQIALAVTWRMQGDRKSETTSSDVILSTSSDVILRMRYNSCMAWYSRDCRIRQWVVVCFPGVCKGCYWWRIRTRHNDGLGHKPLKSGQAFFSERWSKR